MKQVSRAVIYIIGQNTIAKLAIQPRRVVPYLRSLRGMVIDKSLNTHAHAISLPYRRWVYAHNWRWRSDKYGKL